VYCLLFSEYAEKIPLAHLEHQEYIAGPEKTLLTLTVFKTLT
jgi:hypothetical protein